MAAGGGDKVSEAARAGFSMLRNPVVEPVNTRAEIAKAADVSEDTVRKVNVIAAKAPDAPVVIDNTVFRKAG